MSCTRFRNAISARLDGESLGAVDGAQLDAHLSTCADCSAFASAAASLHRDVRLTSAPAVPDLTPAIIAAVDARPAAARKRRAPAADRSPIESQERALRIVLVILGLVQIGIAVPALVLGDDANLPVHVARHLGSFDVALGVAFLFAAWKPQRIAGVLPFVTAFVLCLVGSSLLDVMSGATGAGTEAHHATDIAGLVVLWLLARVPVVHRRPLADGNGRVRLA